MKIFLLKCVGIEKKLSQTGYEWWMWTPWGDLCLPGLKGYIENKLKNREVVR